MKKQIGISATLLLLLATAGTAIAQDGGLAGYVDGHGSEQASGFFNGLLIVANLFGAIALLAAAISLYMLNKAQPPQRIQEAGYKAFWVPIMVAGLCFSFNFFIDFSRETVSGEDEDSETWNKLRGSYQIEFQADRKTELS